MSVSGVRLLSREDYAIDFFLFFLSLFSLERSNQMNRKGNVLLCRYVVGSDVAFCTLLLLELDRMLYYARTHALCSLYTYTNLTYLRQKDDPSLLRTHGFVFPASQQMILTPSSFWFRSRRGDLPTKIALMHKS